MLHCLKCQSERVTNGHIVHHENQIAARFRPEGLRLFAFTLSQGPQMADEAHACLDCGLVWGSTSPEELASFVSKHCDSRQRE